MEKLNQKKAVETSPSSSLLYSATIPVYIRCLGNLLLILGKAERFTKKKTISTVEIINSRLAPDMFTFTQQIQYAYFSALDGATNLSNKKAPTFAYDEKTLLDLKKSLKKTITYLQTIKPKDFKDAEKKKVPVYYNPKKLLPATIYVNTLGLPNFYFHYVTAYDILRHLGVPIGKTDYIGKM